MGQSIATRTTIGRRVNSAIIYDSVMLLLPSTDSVFVCANVTYGLPHSLTHTLSLSLSFIFCWQPTNPILIKSGQGILTYERQLGL